MQYEFPHFRMDRKDWLGGSNTYDNYPDGGIQFKSNGYSAFTKPGWLANSPDVPLNTNIGLPFGVGISWAWGKGIIGQQIMAVGIDSSQNGYFFLQGSGTSTLTQVGSADTSHIYQLGKTDSAFYKGQFYTTSVSDITVQSYDLTSRDTSWWVTTHSKTSLDSFAPHPMVVFGDILQIADGRYIHQNDNGNIQYAALDLGQDWVITAMVNYNNLIYIAAEPYYNFSGYNVGGAKIFTWDGYSDSFLDEYLVDQRVSAMYVFKNILYVWNPKTVSYFTGTAIKSLYPVSRQVYKSMITATFDSLWFADGTELVRYGSPFLTGKPKFHRYFNFANTVYGIIASFSNGLFVMTDGATAGNGFYIPDVNGTPGGNKTFELNTRTFPRPVKIRAYVFHTTPITTGQYVKLSYYDDNDFYYEHGQKVFIYNTAEMLNHGSWRFDVHSEASTTEFTPLLNVAGSVYVKWIDVLYETSEDKRNK